MNTDRKLLELAAKAAGIEYSHAGGYRVIGIGETGLKVMEKINPADDGGDSRMLQVAYKIGMSFTHDDDGVWSVMATNAECDKEAWEPLGNDAKKAARMAVLRCVHAAVAEAVAAEREACEERVVSLFEVLEKPYLPDITRAIHARDKT